MSEFKFIPKEFGKKGFESKFKRIDYSIEALVRLEIAHQLRRIADKLK